MDKIVLSIDEMIYCLYTAGYFEQGNALREVVFPDLKDEQFQQLLQTSCRSLLAKQYIQFQNQKFEMLPETETLIAFMSTADATYQGSKTTTQEVVTVHKKGEEYVLHTTAYDNQIHTIEKISLETAQAFLKQFFALNEQTKEEYEISDQLFEQMLESMDNVELKFELPVYDDAQKRLYNLLDATKGIMNSLLHITYDNSNEPIVNNVLLFTSVAEKNYGIMKENEASYTVYEHAQNLLLKVVQ